MQVLHLINLKSDQSGNFTCIIRNDANGKITENSDTETVPRKKNAFE